MSKKKTINTNDILITLILKYCNEMRFSTLQAESGSRLSQRSRLRRRTFLNLAPINKDLTYKIKQDRIV